MFSKIVTGIDMLLYSLSNLTKKNLNDYCFIDTASSRTTLVAKDGSLISIFAIHGAKKIVGAEELESIQEKFSSELLPIFKKQGHQIQFVFIRDPSRVKSELKRRLDPYWKAARNLKLDLDDLFQSKVDHLAKYCVYESCYMVAWSRPIVIKSEIKEEQAKNNEMLTGLPPAIGAQSSYRIYESLENKHKAFVDLLENALRISEINFKLLEVKEGVREMRKSFDNEGTADDWEPSLPGDKLPMGVKPKPYATELDIGDKLWQSISHQVFTKNCEIVSPDTIRIGGQNPTESTKDLDTGDIKYVSSAYMEVPPQQTRPFKMLLDQLDRDIPLQISIMIEGGGMEKMSLKATAAALLTIANGNNKLIKESIEKLREVEMNGDTVVKVSINAVTWANNTKTLNLNKQTLIKVMQSWGTTDTMLCNSDPIEGFTSTIPGFSPTSPANPFVAPLRDIVPMLPLTRQSHVWEEGAIIYRTEDGKIFPYQPGSGVQTTWNYLIFALPGSGKSVLMNSDNFASVFVPGATEIPYIGIIDIGPSSSGLIQLLKDAAPENMKHLFVYERLKNTIDYSINVFDTQLGARAPTPAERQFLVNFLVNILTPAGKEPFDSSDNLASAVITEIYKYYADTRSGNPKEYIKNRNAEVDEALAKYNINAKGMNWWKVVDTLFELGEKRIASIAQRYAVPLLEECVSIAERTAQIKDIYSKPISDTQETLIDRFSRALSENIAMFPVLNNPTQFDLGEARVVSLDLDEVGKGGSPTDDKRAAIMYLLSRYIIGKNFKLDDSLLKVSPQIYHQYHQERIDKALRTKKRICIDEYHNTGSIQSIRRQVVTDMREGRKWNLQVVLASQVYKDFDDATREISTGRCILSGGDSYRDIQKAFDLNETTAQIVRNRLTGPGKGGVPFVFSVTTKTGIFSQYIFNTISPTEMWAFSTTSEDVTIRRMLTSALGAATARKILATEFPEGSIENFMKRFLKENEYDEVVKSNPYKVIVERLVKRYRQL
jgi:intracellular multiplication protein IcmB